MKKILVTGLVALFASWRVPAGPNSTAELYIDANMHSQEIDSTWGCAAESLFTAGIRITGAVDVYSYQVYLSYDTSRLQFVSAVKGNAEHLNILETAGEPVMFTGNRSLKDSTLILLGASMLGLPASGAAGSGILGLVTFRKTGGDTTDLLLVKPLVETVEAVADTMLKCTGARIVPQGTAIRNYAGSGNRTVRFIGSPGNLRVMMGNGVSCTYRILTVQGKTIHRGSAVAPVFDIPVPGPGNRGSAQNYLVDLHYGDVRQVIGIASCR